MWTCMKYVNVTLLTTLECFLLFNETNFISYIQTDEINLTPSNFRVQTRKVTNSSSRNSPIMKARNQTNGGWNSGFIYGKLLRRMFHLYPQLQLEVSDRRKNSKFLRRCKHFELRHWCGFRFLTCWFSDAYNTIHVCLLWSFNLL